MQLNNTRTPWTLRDEIAMRVLISGRAHRAIEASKGVVYLDSGSEYALAYHQADAMLDAREPSQVTAVVVGSGAGNGGAPNAVPTPLFTVTIDQASFLEPLSSLATWLRAHPPAVQKIVIDRIGADLDHIGGASIVLERCDGSDEYIVSIKGLRSICARSFEYVLAERAGDRQAIPEDGDTCQPNFTLDEASILRPFSRLSDWLAEQPGAATATMDDLVTLRGKTSGLGRPFCEIGRLVLRPSDHPGDYIASVHGVLSTLAISFDQAVGRLCKEQA